MISLDNLFLSWDLFRRGKRARSDVMTFERRLEDNVFDLHEALAGATYYRTGWVASRGGIPSCLSRGNSA
jgi:hypothetical protein